MFCALWRLEGLRQLKPALWVHQSFIWWQNDTSCLVFLPVLMLSSILVAFIGCHCTLQQWLQRAVRVTEGSTWSCNCQFQIQHHAWMPYIRISFRCSIPFFLPTPRILWAFSLLHEALLEFYEGGMCLDKRA